MKLLSTIEPNRFYKLGEFCPRFDVFGICSDKKFAVKLENDIIIDEVLYEGYGMFSKEGKILTEITEFKLL